MTGAAISTSTVFGTIAALAVSRVFFDWFRKVWLTASSPDRLNEKRKQKRIAEFEDIPGSYGWPFFGLLLEAMPYVQKKRIDLFIESEVDKFGGICKIWNGNKCDVVIDDPAMAKQILNSPDFFHRSDLVQYCTYEYAKFALFALPSGDQWKKHRKGLQPAFGPVHLRDAFDVSLSTVDCLLNIWEKHLKNGECTRNVMEDFTMLTGDVIAKVGFSADIGAVKGLENKTVGEFHHNMNIITHSIENRLNFREIPIFLYFYGALAYQIKPAVKVLTDLLTPIINEKSKKLSSASPQDQWKKDLLDRLLETQGTFQFTDEEIMSEVFGFFLAGHETTSNALTWVMYELVHNEESKKKLVEEIDTLLKGEQPTSEILPKLRYLDAYVKETLRIHPVIVGVARDCVQECVLTGVDGFQIRIPKGHEYYVDAPRLQKLPKYWGPNAEEFYPDRWLEDGFTPVPGSYLPFGDGQMSCIGQKMALIESKVAIIRILQRFDVKLSSKQKGSLEPVLALTLGLKDGLWIDFSNRN